MKQRNSRRLNHVLSHSETEMTQLVNSKIDPNQTAKAPIVNYELDKESPLELYLNELRLKSSEELINSVIRVFNSIAHHLGARYYRDIPWKKIDYEAFISIREILIGLSNDDKSCPTLKKSTVATYISYLKCVLEKSYELGIISSDDYIKILKVKSNYSFPKTSVAVPSVINFNAYIDSIENSCVGARDKSILLLICDCGLRPNEVVNVFLEDFLWPTNELAILDGARKFVKRSTFLTAKTITSIETWLRYRNISHGPLFTKIHHQGSIGEDPLSRSAITYICNNHNLSTELQEDVSPKTLHSCFINWLYDRNIKIEDIHHLTGNASISTTFSYIDKASDGFEKIQFDNNIQEPAIKVKNS